MEGEGECRQNEEGWRARLLKTDRFTGLKANTHLHIQTHKGHHAPTALQTHMQRHRYPCKHSKTDTALISPTLFAIHTKHTPVICANVHQTQNIKVCTQTYFLKCNGSKTLQQIYNSNRDVNLKALKGGWL